MRFQQVCCNYFLKHIFEQTWQGRSLSCRITVGRLCWVIQPSLFAGHLRELSKFKGKRWERRERERKGAVRILYLSISCQSSFSKICKTRHNIFGTPGQLAKWQLSKWQLAKWQLAKWQLPEKQATKICMICDLSDTKLNNKLSIRAAARVWNWSSIKVHLQ